MNLSADLKEQAMAFMKSVAQRSGDPFYTVSPAEGFRFTFVNDAACRLFGRSREEMLALTLPDVSPLFSQAQWSAFWEKLQKKGAIFFETVHRHADGSEIPVAVSANYFAQGGRELFGGCIHDLREQRRSEEALKESEEMLRVIFNSTYDGILLHTADGVILDANEPLLRMYGMTREQALQLRIEDISSPAMPMEEAPAIWARVMAGEPQLFEWKALRYADHSEFDVEVFLRKVRVQGQEAILANLRDITARKQLEGALTEAKNEAEAGSRAKDRFLVNMSHELRTPLTVTMGMLELSLLEESSPSLRRYLEAALQSSETLLALIRDLLDISLIEKGENIVEEKPFDLRSCIREAIGRYFPMAAEKGIGLNLKLAENIPHQVSGDSKRLTQILDNLLKNAIRFTDHGEVDLIVFAGEEASGRREVHFSVRDTGIGIPEEALGRIFKKFTQVDDSLTRRYGGSGLGLAICRGLVERMGGRIAVESQGGKGSVFSFVLPLKIEETRELTPESSDTENSEAEPSAVRILLAEDEPTVREMVRIFLEKRGWKAEMAESGKEAVAKWQQGKFDLVLMDVRMPEMSGLEATRLIRKMEDGTKEPTCIIALTAHAGQQSREECFKAGMNDFVLKPIKIGELYAAIDECLKRK